MIKLAAALVLAQAEWKPVTISYYSSGKVTADGTKMRLDGEWAATRLVPLGTKIEVRVGGKVLKLTVRDKTAKRFGHRLDIPRDTWKRWGRPTSRGLLKGHWRVKG